MTITESLESGGNLLILCRTDKVDDVLKLFRQSETRLLVMNAAQRDF